MTKVAPVLTPLPERALNFTRDALQRLARDLRWTWHPEAAELFHDLDPEGWEASGHNPEWLLQQLPTARLRTAIARSDFELRLQAVVSEFDTFRTGTKSWFREAYPGTPLSVGLFAAEFALADCLPIAAGGLGAVAGETLKTASALGVPTVGVGLRYSETSHQWLDADCRQHETWETVAPSDLPVTLAHDRLGFPVVVTAPLPHGPVGVRVWKAHASGVRGSCSSTPTSRATRPPIGRSGDACTRAIQKPGCSSTSSSRSPAIARSPRSGRSRPSCT